jgi:long-chain acyl-CoA synthetase
MIIRSGLKVYPARVEKILMTHERVADAAVIGRADPVHTEEVVAFIVRKSSDADREILSGELRELCRNHLAPYEVPSKFNFIDQIPRSALGKLLKKELRVLPDTEIPRGPEKPQKQRKAA